MHSNTEPAHCVLHKSFKFSILFVPAICDNSEDSSAVTTHKKTSAVPHTELFPSQLWTVRHREEYVTLKQMLYLKEQ